MNIQISLTKSVLENFNYIDDKCNYPTKTSLIKDLINKEALRLRAKYNEFAEYKLSDDFKVATCHPTKKHYAKGFCRTCYLKKRYV